MMIFEIASGVSIFMFLWISVSVIYFNTRQMELLNLDRDNKIRILNMIDEKLFSMDEKINKYEYDEYNKVKYDIINSLK